MCYTYDMQPPGEGLACARCPLHEGRHNVVWGFCPSPGPRLVLVGEAPGYYEDRSGKPFAGRSGKLLDSLLIRAGLNRAEVYVTNRVKCRPPGNREPLPHERAACMPWLESELHALVPQVVVLLGKTASTFAFPTGKTMGELRHLVRAMPQGEQVSLFLTTYHPAAALRNPELEAVIIEDLKRARGFLA